MTRPSSTKSWSEQRQEDRLGTRTEQLDYHVPVVLQGQLFTDFYYGRPNYGSSPELDEVEHAVILALDTPIAVGRDAPAEPESYDVAEGGVDRVQLAATDHRAFNQLRGHGVEVRGRLYHAHTGHHHTAVLLEVEGEPQSVDRRGLHASARPVASGSGFLLGNDGLIATAAHVLEGADCFSVMRGLYRARAELIAMDEGLDLAVLKIDPEGVMADVLRERETQVRPIRSWMPARLGERVYAFGFPLSGTLPHSLNVTEGLISSELGLQPHLFQMSAAIQPGNSGGPVFDAFGNLLGVAVSSLEPAQTLNFCVHGRDLHAFCREYGATFDLQEIRGETISPVSLADNALRTCLEIEAWTAVR